jgi:outer membrane protein TolC
MQLSQPLLKGFGKLATKYNIYLSGKDYKISKLQLQQNIVNLIYEVEQAYWQLVLAYQELETTKMALQLARDTLRQNEIKVKVGTAAPIEILSSKAQVAQNESALIQREQTIQLREESLKRILNMSKEAFALFPTDKPELKDMPVDFDSYLVEALQNRLDIKQAKLELEKQNISVKYAKNQALPDLSLTAQFYAYGRGGTEWQVPPGVSPFDPGFTRIKILEAGLWDAWNEVFKMTNKNYTVTLNLSIPLGFKREKAELARARINLERTLLQLKNTENTVYSDVKQVIKKLESNKKLVDANKVAEQLQLETLKAEEKKLSVGISTNFEVLTYQNAYANARLSALRSVIDYMLTVAEITKTLNRTFKAYNINFSDYYSNK